MNRTTTWIFVCAVGAVSLLELALAALNYLHHGRWIFIIGPLMLALGLSLLGLSTVLRKRNTPAGGKVPAPPVSRRLAGPGRTFHRS